MADNNDLWEFAGPGERRGEFANLPALGDSTVLSVDITGRSTPSKVEPVENLTITLPDNRTTHVDLTRQEQLLFENPLHAYASYTYNLSLHMISIETYNRIINNNFVNDSPTPYVPENVLISGAGRYNDTDFKRNQYFKEDFYFEDFRMQTVITPNMRNRNTNLIECSFTIIEPNGFTLINRMIAAANQINTGFIGSPSSYIKIPYVLQIDFFGYKEEGDTKPEKISNLTKIIPICLVNVETQVRQSGAEYKVEAVAFNHQVFSQVNNTIPFHTTIQAKSVSAAFNIGTGDNALSDTYTSRIQNLDRVNREITKLQTIKDQINSGVLELNGASPYEYLDDTEVRLSNLNVERNYLTNTAIDASGICAALNSYYRALKDLGTISYNTTFRVEFDPEIASATLFQGSQPVSATNAATTRNAPQLAYSAGVINIPPGTSLTNLIDFVVRNSTYITDQIVLPTAEAIANVRNDIVNGKRPEEIRELLNKPLNWFKIVPTLKVGKWDNKLNRFTADTIILYVRTFTISSKYPYGPLGRVPGYVKKYDYLFTGRNRDVLDWNINFNTLYLLAVSGNLSKEVQGTMAPGLNPVGSAANPNAPGTNGVIPAPGDIVATPGILNTSGNSDTTTPSGGNVLKSVAGAELAKSLYLDARGDMIELELKIIGDPHFIKQDDVFYSRPAANKSISLTPNNSLYMDTGELYVFVNFISPVDYDEGKGLAEVRANDILGSENEGAISLGYSNFSGVYKVITVDSVFSRGKFEQTLRMAKILYDQLGTSINVYRAEQARQLSLAVNRGTAAATRFATPGNEFIYQSADTAAAAINNIRLNIDGRINDVIGGAVTAVINGGPSVVRESNRAIVGDISINDQPTVLTTTQNTPNIINSVWLGDSSVLG